MTQRPLAISAVCVVGAIAGLIAAVLFSVNGLWAVPPTTGQKALALSSVAVTAAGLYGMWRMRRWGVGLLALGLAARVAYGLAAGLPWNPPALAGPVLMLLVGLVYLRKMT